MLNLGVRFDFYPAFQVKATSDRPAEIVNLESPTDLRLMDFGAPRPPDDIYNPDWFNIGPRAGFAWTLDEAGDDRDSRRHRRALQPDHAGADPEQRRRPVIGAATSYNRTELAARDLKWGNYADEIQDAVRADAPAGRRSSR